MSSRNNYRRYNPLLDEWVIVAANRVNRPWQGTKSDAKAASGFSAVTGINALAPGGERANGKVTPEYDSVYVFENDFPSFTHFPASVNKTSKDTDEDELFKQEEIHGECRVICYHPNSEKSIALMDETEVLAVVQLWCDQFNELSRKWTYVQIFENRGAAVGSSNSHPHGQIWAGSFVPTLPQRKDLTQKAYFERHGRPLLLDYLEKELDRAKDPAENRVILLNEDWVVLVPFWALWPFETMLLPRRHMRRMDELTKSEKRSLAAILRQLMIKYDNIFECSFAFGMGWIGAPTPSGYQGSPELAEDHYKYWQLHLLVHPPLLRSSSISKHMAGYEILAEPQRDITPEMAAETIRSQSALHYTAARNTIQKS